MWNSLVYIVLKDQAKVLKSLWKQEIETTTPLLHILASPGVYSGGWIGLCEIYEVAVRGIVFCLVLIREWYRLVFLPQIQPWVLLATKSTSATRWESHPELPSWTFSGFQILHDMITNRVILGKRQDALYLALLHEAIINARQIQKGNWV